MKNLFTNGQPQYCSFCLVRFIEEFSRVYLHAKALKESGCKKWFLWPVSLVILRMVNDIPGLLFIINTKSHVHFLLSVQKCTPMESSFQQCNTCMEFVQIFTEIIWREALGDNGVVDKKGQLTQTVARDSVIIREYWLPVAYDASGAPW